MANTKISALTSGNPAQSGDQVPINRGGSNFSITAGSIAALAPQGTVTSVAASFTGGLISITGSPITGSGTLGLTIAGTSGGIPYFASSSTWASSGALTASALVLGGGSGASPTVLGSLGTTTTVLHGNAAGAPTFSSIVAADITNNTITGTQLAPSLALVTPLLGTPTSGVMTNVTGLTEAGLTLADNTTANASTSAHGFLLKLNNSATQFMNGQGAWATPAPAGASTALDNLASVAINTAPLPGTDNSIALGSATKRWTNTHAVTFTVYGATSGSVTISASSTGGLLNLGPALSVDSAGTVFSGGSYYAEAASGFVWSAGRSVMLSPADGIIRLSNNAGTGFERLQFGGTTSSFPSLKRSTTSLVCRLADDSSDAPFSASAYTANGSAGVSAGSFSAITAITTVGGIVTQLTGTSDERLKDYVPYNGGLEEVLRITPVRYTWNEAGQKHTGISGNKEYVGFLAQDVQKAIPEAITATENSKDGTAEYLSLDDRPIIAALVNAVKKLSAKVNSLQIKIANM